MSFHRDSIMSLCYNYWRKQMFFKNEIIILFISIQSLEIIIFLAQIKLIHIDKKMKDTFVENQ